MNNINPIIIEILRNRGITEEKEVLEFLSEKPNLTYDPFLLKNLEAGVDFLLSCISENKKICVYGDYDADGVTAISLMMQVLSKLTDNISYYIPSRIEEGYGLNKEAIEHIRANGTELIITVDCGSVSHEEVEYGKSIGMNFIVTDHHNINDTPSDCILINPKQSDCNYPFKHLAGCGVAFKFAQGIQRKANLPKSILNDLLDLVAIATIGDIVPLVDENRTLTKYGMSVINSGKRKGLNKLIEETGLNLGNIKSENVAYVIVPHLNAAGRLLDARVGVELLTSSSDEIITKDVENLVNSNKERKRIQEEAFQKCKEIIEAEHLDDLFLTVIAREIHEGIAGIVAGKIKDEYGKPAIIVTPSCGEDFLKGSGRSLRNINLYDILKKHEDMFIKFGGHSGACGFLMNTGNIEELRKVLNDDIAKLFENDSQLFDCSIPVDIDINSEELSIELAHELEKLAPFGCQNEKPLFQIKEIKPSNMFYMGNNSQHVRFCGQGKAGKGFSCIMFQKAQEYRNILEEGGIINIAGYPDINVWNGNTKVQFVLKGINN